MMPVTMPRPKPKPEPTPRPKPRPEPLPPAQPKPEITQDELVRYRRMSARLKLLENDVSELRRSLIDRVKRRASVEPGKWLPQVSRQESRHFSAEVVEAAVGTEAMRAMLAAIKPTVREGLVIIPDESA